MKKIYLIMMILCINSIHAQVGINQEQPTATLQIDAINTDGSTKEGIIIPRLSKSAIAAMGTDVTESTIVYVNNVDIVPDGTQTETVAQVFEKGFYSFIDGTWNRHKLNKNAIDLNKEYVCNNDNIGQVLNTTAPGYFICRNEAMFDDGEGNIQTVTGDPKWEYIGVLEGSAYYTNNENNTEVQRIVNITLFQDGEYYYVPTYETIAELYGFQSQYPNNNNGIGFSDVLPSPGYLAYTYWPNYGCGKQIVSGFDNNETYLITETGDGDIVCGSDLIKLQLLERHIHYRIID